MNTKWKQVGTVPRYGMISTPAVFCYNRNAPQAGVSPRPDRSSYTDVDFTWNDYRDHGKSKQLVVDFRGRVNLSASGPGPGFYLAPPNRVVARFLEGQNGWKSVWASDSHAICG
ncbi:MAG: hypothetical protein QOF70_2591 [Acetobacteraceae bacterium]|jgi:hypothetical protein|nr:hypothetical protein [Acetobacteraceae bacterium]